MSISATEMESMEPSEQWSSYSSSRALPLPLEAVLVGVSLGVGSLGFMGVAGLIFLRTGSAR